MHNDHVISHKGSCEPFDVLTGVALIDWQMLILTAIILLEINWHKSILTEWEDESFEQRCKKKNGCKNKAIKASNQWSNCPHGSLIIHQMCQIQRAVCKCQWQPLSLPGWKILQNSLNFHRFCLDSGFSAVIPKK